jgi:hypothetical protein
LGATELITTELAPTMTLFPILYGPRILQPAANDTLSPISHRSALSKLMSGFRCDISHENLAGRRGWNECRPDIVADY